jgi:hypothetical protein
MVSITAISTVPSAQYFQQFDDTSFGQEQYNESYQELDQEDQYHRQSFEQEDYDFQAQDQYFDDRMREVKRRRRLAPEETRILNQVFDKNPKPSSQVRAQLAQQLNMTSRAVQIWFQNRRAKLKRDTAEMTFHDLSRASSSASHRDNMMTGQRNLRMAPILPRDQVQPYPRLFAPNPIRPEITLKTLVDLLDFQNPTTGAPMTMKPYNGTMNMEEIAAVDLQVWDSIPSTRRSTERVNSIALPPLMEESPEMGFQSETDIGDSFDSLFQEANMAYQQQEDEQSSQQEQDPKWVMRLTTRLSN